MKKFLLNIAMAAISAAAFAQNKEETPYLTKSLANETISNVEVATSGGSISVAGVAQSEARVEVYVHTNNSDDQLPKDEIKKRLEENYDLNITVTNSKVSAVATPRDKNINWKKSLSISFKVFAPKNINTMLKTSGGSISLKNLAGSQTFKTSGGSISVDNLSGETEGRTSGGSIRVSNSTNDIKLTTSGGSIQAENCTGNLRLSTSGGSLSLTNLSGNIEARTSGGSINGSNIQGELLTSTSGGSIRLNDLMCSLETSTSGGSIDVNMKSVGKYIKISNSAGNIDLQVPNNKGLDLSLAGRSVSVRDMQGFKGKADKEQVEGELNGGGIPVTIRAGNGRVSLTTR